MELKVATELANSAPTQALWLEENHAPAFVASPGTLAACETPAVPVDRRGPRRPRLHDTRGEGR